MAEPPLGPGADPLDLLAQAQAEVADRRTIATAQRHLETERYARRQRVLAVFKEAAERLRRFPAQDFPSDAELDLFAAIGACLAEPIFAGWLDQLEAASGACLRPTERRLAIAVVRLATQSERERLAQVLQQIRRDEDLTWHVAEELDSVGNRVRCRLTGDLTGWGLLPAAASDAAAAGQEETRPHLSSDAASATTGPAPEIDQEAQALALLFQHRDWSVADIAAHMGVSRQTRYRWTRFRDAAERSGRLRPRGPKDGTIRRGHKTSDGRVEAYADDEEE